MKELLFASNNVGKIREVTEFSEPSGIKIITPLERNLVSANEETGKSFRENAILKVKNLLTQTSTDTIVIADDSGLEIDALNGEPGVYTRRWSGQEMTDEEILSLCLKKLAGIPLPLRTARFKTVMAVGKSGTEIQTFEGQLEGILLEKPRGLVQTGMPFAPLFFVPEWNMLLSDTYDIPPQEKRHLQSHRTRAFIQALPYIQSL